MLPKDMPCPAGYDAIATITLKAEVPGLTAVVDRPLQLCERYAWSSDAFFEQYPVIIGATTLALIATQTMCKTMPLTKNHADTITKLIILGLSGVTTIAYVVHKVSPYLIPDVHKAPGVLKEPHEKLMLALEAWQMAKAEQKMAEDARDKVSDAGEESEVLHATLILRVNDTWQAKIELDKTKNAMVMLCEATRSQLETSPLLSVYEDLLICDQYHLEHNAVREEALAHRTFRWEFDDCALLPVVARETMASTQLQNEMHL